MRTRTSCRSLNAKRGLRCLPGLGQLIADVQIKSSVGRARLDSASLGPLVEADIHDPVRSWPGSRVERALEEAPVRAVDGETAASAGNARVVVAWHRRGDPQLLGPDPEREVMDALSESGHQARWVGEARHVVEE